MLDRRRGAPLVSALPVAIFLLLVGKLIPIYLLIGLGYVAGRFLGTKREMLARLLLYIVVPPVVFHGVATTKLDGAILSLPLVFFAICVTLCLLSYAVSRRLWADTTPSILAYACGTGNNGYFGLPLVIALFGESAVGISVIIGMGFLLYEVTVGFLMVARGSMTLRPSVGRVLTLPLIYAFVLGLLVNAMHVHIPAPLNDLLVNFRGAYSVFGMMLVGMGLSSIRHLFVDVKFLAVSFAFKFLLWPLLMLAFIAADRTTFHLYSETVHHVMLTLAIVPLAANTVIYATELDVHPEKAASAVLLSTLFALVYIPLVVMWFF